MSDSDKFDSEYVNAPNWCGQTRLFRAAETGDMPLVKKLIAEGANISLMDNLGVTARIAAKRNGHKEIDEYLSILEEERKPSETLAEKARLAFDASEAVKKLRAQKESELAEKLKKEKQRAEEDKAVWFYSKDLEAREGPIPFIAMRKLHEEGSISDSTLVWSPEINDWKPLHEVIEQRTQTSTDKNKVQNSYPLSAEKKNLENIAPRQKTSSHSNKEYIPVEEFSEFKGIATDKAIAMIRDGFYQGKIMDDKWYVAYSEVEKTTQSTQPSTGGFFRQLVNGDFGLAKTYWLYGVLVGVFANILSSVITSIDALVIFMIIYTAYEIPVFIGIWSASDKYQGPSVWAVLSKIAVILGVIMLAINYLAINLLNHA